MTTKLYGFLSTPKTTGRGRPESTGFVLGENYGFIKGVSPLSGIRLHLVRPQEWQAGITGIKGKEYKERKNLIWEEAKRLFPAPAHVTKKCGCMDDPTSRTNLK